MGKLVNIGLGTQKIGATCRPSQIHFRMADVRFNLEQAKKMSFSWKNKKIKFLELREGQMFYNVYREEVVPCNFHYYEVLGIQKTQVIIVEDPDDCQVCDIIEVTLPEDKLELKNLKEGQAYEPEDITYSNGVKYINFGQKLVENGLSDKLLEFKRILNINSSGVRCDGYVFKVVGERIDVILQCHHKTTYVRKVVVKKY